MTETSNPDFQVDFYWQYLCQNCSDLDTDKLITLSNDLKDIDWEEPDSALELNNFAVLALIEAEQEENTELRAINLELALEALTKGAALKQHPLCAAHLALVHGILGESEEAAQIAFSNLIGAFQPAYNSSDRLPMGLIYIPSRWKNLAIARREQFHRFLSDQDGYSQALLLFTEVLCQIQLVFYNIVGLRFLQLAAQLSPHSVEVNLKLGLASLLQQQWEGLLYLQRARKLAPDCAPVLQALYLAYRDPQQPETGSFWLKTAQQNAPKQPLPREWRWTELSSEDPITYLPFEEDLLLAIEAKIHSLVNSVLLAEGDWFEAEMEFWRNQIQPGMTVIDVGANVGVYTFSAARRVGETGRVLAVEPFSGCVRCLEETQRVNDLAWVTVCAGAASDRNSTMRLFLRSASELNRVVSNEETESESESDKFEEISCFTLDHLAEQNQLTQVDWLKIDAEGHELQVLKGSDRILSQFAPKILYENVAGLDSQDEGASNTSVAEFLIAKGYRLFYYRPYVQELIPISSTEELRGNLNIIAIPAKELEG